MSNYTILKTSSVSEIESVASRELCLHCDLEIPSSLRGTSKFCCKGCEAVYRLVHHLGLEQFYDLRRLHDPSSPAPADISIEDYSFLDDPQFENDHVYRRSADECEVSLYLSGIHCAACVWLLEQLSQCCPGVTQVRVQITSSTINLKYNPKLKRLSEVAHLLASLGYTPFVLHSDAHKLTQDQERTRLLLRIGVAGLAAGNSMMLAVSLFQGWFSGIEPRYEALFVWLSALVTLPAVTFSAMPFYRAALAGLSLRKLHIDLPISIGILAGYVLSLVNLSVGNSHVYFDSVSMLIFLLLVGRWLQRDGLNRVSTQGALLRSCTPMNALVENADGTVKQIYTASVKVGDTVIVAKDQRIPVDGVLLDATAHLDCSLLTGESEFVKKSEGDAVYAGTFNRGSTLKIRARAIHHDTRLAKLLQQIEVSQSEKSPLVQKTDALAAVFVKVVLLLSAGTGLYWYSVGGLALAVERVLALLVVSCPCALGLAAPVSYSVALRGAARAGLFIKNAKVLESATRIRRIFLDKTGTLTEGHPHVSEVFLAETLPTELIPRIVATIENESQHPIACALRAWVGKGEMPLEHSELKEIDGSGIEAQVNLPAIGSKNFRLGSAAWCLPLLSASAQHELTGVISRPAFAGKTLAVLTCEQELLAVFAITDPIKAEASELVSDLRKEGYSLEIISGDRQIVVDRIAEVLGIPKETARGELSPEAKMAIIRAAESQQSCMMVGDGANDAAALHEAHIGVALHGGAELSMRVADVYCAERDLRLVQGLFQGARQTQWVIRRSLIFSAGYNVLGASLAMLGFIGPLSAAILMPLSSATVVLSSLSLLRWRWNVGTMHDLKQEVGWT